MGYWQRMAWVCSMIQTILNLKKNVNFSFTLLLGKTKINLQY